MEEFLSRRGVLFKDLKTFVLKRAERLKAHTHAVGQMLAIIRAHDQHRDERTLHHHKRSVPTISVCLICELLGRFLIDLLLIDERHTIAD